MCWHLISNSSLNQLSILINLAKTHKKNPLQQLGKSTPYLSQLGIFSSRARCRLRIARFGVDCSLPRDDFLCIFLHALACVRTKASSPRIWREQDARAARVRTKAPTARAACVRTKAWLGAGSEGGVRGGLGEVVAGELEEQRRRAPMMQTKVMPPEGKEDGLDRYFICVGPTSGPTFYFYQVGIRSCWRMIFFFTCQIK
jgi:hypothetical protein